MTRKHAGARPPIVAVVGRGGSGRTTVLEGLIPELTRRGYKVATAKHHAHETDIDVPGKDTWRHGRAGAKVTMVSAPNRLGVFRSVDRERTLEELASIAEDADILLTEGFSRVASERVEVVRAARSMEPLFPPEELFALVTDVPSIEEGATKVLALDDHRGLADLIEKSFLRPAGRKEQSQVVYLDHAATSWPTPKPVVDAAMSAMTEGGGSPGRGAHSLSLSAARAVLEARCSCARLLGVSDPRNVLFQPGCTAACNLMLKGLLRPGDRVVVGSMEHNAVARPLAQLASDGVEVVIVKGDRTGLIDPGDVEKEVRAGRTRAVICQHASNVTGTIQLMGEMGEVAHEHGALLLVDGAQAAGHLEVDLGSLGADAYAVSGHKGMLGPQGVGLLYLSADVEATEQITGGTGSSGPGALEMPKERPERYEAGTMNTPGAVGLGAAAKLLAEDGKAARARTGRLVKRLLEGVAELPGYRFLGPSPELERAPLVSVVHETIEADRLAFVLDREFRIAARAGLHCAPWAHETVGTIDGGALRISFGLHSRDDDVDVVLSALTSVARKKR